MSDEFPTLEVALAGSAVVLLWRAGLLWNARRELAELSASAGPERVLEHFQKHSGRLFEPVLRAGMSARESGASADAQRSAVAERAHRVGRRLRNAGARDIVICAVLLGALVYAGAANLELRPSFFLLGGAASALLVVTALLAVRSAVRIETLGADLGDLLARMSATGSHTAARRCAVCGAAPVVVESADELGPRLLQLGVERLAVCAHCGHVGGHAATPSRPAH
ncbi:MAG TPA: hypothetical protein VER33_08770 [Polyangiaceae bacterium]|nr:hypothetical protein [Polyangiaceae bacterium]